MSFQRARNEENKKIRLQQIKDTAIRLLNEMPYHDISLSKIGKEINFTRANLYKYVSSKEDIYIYVLSDELYKVTEAIEEAFIGTDLLSTKDFAYKWGETLNQFPVYLKLSSIMFMILEQNASLNVLVEFKNDLNHCMRRIGAALAVHLPGFAPEDIGKVIDFSMSYAMSRYPLCNPTDIQRQATEASEIHYVFPEFVSSYAEAVELLIKGIKVSKL